MNRFRSLAFVLAFLFGAVALAASVSGSLTVSRGPVSVASDGSASITILYTSASGSVRQSRTLYVDVGCTRVQDQEGTIIANPAPAALCNAILNFTSALDGLIVSAAAAGKVNP